MEVIGNNCYNRPKLKLVALHSFLILQSAAKLFVKFQMFKFIVVIAFPQVLPLWLLFWSLLVFIYSSANAWHCSHWRFNRKGTLVLNVAQRLEIARGSATGIAYLHEKKLIHRDIKRWVKCLQRSCTAYWADCTFLWMQQAQYGNKRCCFIVPVIGFIIAVSVM